MADDITDQVLQKIVKRLEDLSGQVEGLGNLIGQVGNVANSLTSQLKTVLENQTRIEKILSDCCQDHGSLHDNTAPE
jgi:uncharacterized protein YoxC